MEDFWYDSDPRVRSHALRPGQAADFIEITESYSTGQCTQLEYRAEW